MGKDRKLIRVGDALIIVLLLAAAFGGYLAAKAPRNGSFPKAVITQNGGLIAEIPLNSGGSYEYPEIPKMIFIVRDGSIAVAESDCGDKTCVRTGAASRVGEAIICVPKRVAVTIEDDRSENDLDVVLK